jgi:hypothetical protein
MVGPVVMKYFTYTGQPGTEFPEWVIFMNIAYCPDFMLIHQFEGRVRVNLGSTISRREDGFIEIVEEINIASTKVVPYVGGARREETRSEEITML